MIGTAIVFGALAICHELSMIRRDYKRAGLYIVTILMIGLALAVGDIWKALT